MSDTDNGLPFEPWDFDEDDETPPDELDTPEGASDFIREAVRQDLAPRVDNLVAAPLRDDVDGGRALAAYLLRAAETGENAKSRLDRLGDLDSLNDDERAILGRTRELLFNAAAWVYFDDGRAPLTDVVTDLERTVDAITAASDQSDRPDLDDLPRADTHPDDTSWAKHTEDSMARIEGPLVNSRLDPDFGDAITTRIELLEVGQANVPISIAVDATSDEAGVELGVTAQLSPEQAQGLADRLYEHAEAARQNRGDKGDE